MSKRVAPKAINEARSLDAPNASPKSQTDAYAAFAQIDGRHPWQASVPEGFVGYPVRQLERGKLLYFNFALAREMGLISATHPDQMTPALERRVLETFSIQIINEYDQANGTRFARQSLKPHPHMATRYLQLQHANKQGRTSGDGRGIWNGTYRHKGTTWDVSSRGTGVTCLAPGAVQANRHLKTGETEFGYGCGQADVSELMGSAVLSEIFHLNGVNTERVLTIIDLGKGCGIGVRAASNLIRPAHLFLYLKQGRIDVLRGAVDYMIRRQVDNKQWKFSPHTPDRYRRMLSEIAVSFARFAAKLEREYIFAWMDWDGDNVLANAGIIDYGSIRQFGLRHDQYRYDDVDRYSTNLNEQRAKARLIVQVFAQMVDYLETGKRRSIASFETHAAVREYDRECDFALRELFLSQCGLDARHITELMTTKRSLVEELYSSFLTLERTKTKAGERRVPDGVNRPAIFNMRSALRELPQMIARESDWAKFRNEELLDLIASPSIKRVDRRLTRELSSRLSKFQRSYLKVLQAACGETGRANFLRGVVNRAEELNRSARITGNGAEFVVDELLKARRRGLTNDEVQNAMELFIASQSPKSALGGRRIRPVDLQSNAGKLFLELAAIAEEFQEDI